jgi:Yip1 domain
VASPILQSAQPPERDNSFGRLVGVIFSPKETFASIARRPTWVLPIVLLTVLTLCVIGAFGKRVGWRAFFEKQDASSSRFEQASPEQQRQSLEAQVKYGAPFVYVTAALTSLLGAAVVAAIFWGVFNGVMGAKFGFKSSMAIVAHSWVPGMLLALLGVVVIFLKDPSTIDLQNLVASNAGAFVSSDSAKWLTSLLTSLDLFAFWYMILMAIGYSAAAPKKLPFGTALVTIFVLWAIFVVCKVGFAAAFS